MGMNLREFLSNHQDVNDALPENARARSSVQKVLGIQWDSIRDTLTIGCDLRSTPTLTKRIVARQIASVYDSFGWLVPLMTLPKRFQQNLWKHKYTWDQILPQGLRDEWNTLIENANGFQRAFDRRLLIHPTESSMAVFADASAIAMSACAYLSTQTSHH
ncbi:hypothetical protein Aduo_015548 [Ancylostoma duodenale]